MLGFDPRAGAIKLFSFAGTPVYAQTSYFVFSAIIVLMHSSGEDGSFVIGFSFALAIFLSLLVHEFGHVFAGRSVGCTSAVVLWMLGGLTVFDRRHAGWKHVWVSFAGPLAGFVFWAILWFFVTPDALLERGLDHSRIFEFGIISYEHDPGWYVLWRHLCFINLVWGLVNLLPIFPLDGGQIFHEILRIFGVRQFEAQKIGAIVAIIVLVLALGYAAAAGYTSLFLFLMVGMLIYQNYLRYSSA